MPRIVGIHGINQQIESGPELTHPWYLAIRGGLEAAGYRSTADELAEADLRVVFFGDLFRPLAPKGQGHKAGGDPPYTSSSISAGFEQDLLEMWYADAVDHEPALGPPSGAKGPGRVAVHHMLERLLRSRTFAGVAERAFIGNLKQVTAFLSDTHIKDRVLQRVDAEVTGDTTVVIGHSLGSVVAYEYLAQFAPPQVDLLITVGSPLGIPNLIFDRLTPRPIGGKGAWPGKVSRWVNVVDKNDTVALRRELASLFPSNNGQLAVEDRSVDNGPEAHAIRPYLNAWQTGEALGSAL